MLTAPSPGPPQKHGLANAGHRHGDTCQHFSLYPKGGWFSALVFLTTNSSGSRNRLQRLCRNLNIQSCNFPKSFQKTLHLAAAVAPPAPCTYTVIWFYLNSGRSCFLVKPQSLKTTSSTHHNPLCGRNRHTILYCSLYNTLSCTFCSERTETPLKASAISMQEAKENLVSDLIQDKSMCTHLLLRVPISSRRDSVLEFQGYPRWLCTWKTHLALSDILRTSFERFPGVQVRDGKSQTPSCFSPLPVRSSGRGHARTAAPYLPARESQLILVIHLRQEPGSLIRVCTALRDSHIRCTRKGSVILITADSRDKHTSPALLQLLEPKRKIPQPHSPTCCSHKATGITGTAFFWTWSELPLQDRDLLLWL